jgi:hypothetical protein
MSFISIFSKLFPPKSKSSKEVPIAYPIATVHPIAYPIATVHPIAFSVNNLNALQEQEINSIRKSVTPTSTVKNQVANNAKKLFESQKKIADKYKNNLFGRIGIDNLGQLKIFISRILKNNETFNYQLPPILNVFQPSLKNKDIIHYLLYELQNSDGKTLLEFANELKNKEIYDFLRKLYVELPYEILLDCFNQNNNAINSSITKVKLLLDEKYIITSEQLENFILEAFNSSKFKLLKYLIEIKFEINDLLQYPQSNTINYNRTNIKTRNIRVFMQSLKDKQEKNKSQNYTNFIKFLNRIKKNKGTSFEKSHYYK